MSSKGRGVELNWEGQKSKHGLSRFDHEIASLFGVQMELADHAGDISRQAQLNLAINRSEGHSFISEAHGDIDWYVELNAGDTDGGAAAIEFGRAGYMYQDEEGRTQVWGAMEGNYILIDAAGLRRHGPRRRAPIRLTRKAFLKMLEKVKKKGQEMP